MAKTKNKSSNPDSNEVSKRTAQKAAKRIEKILEGKLNQIAVKKLMAIGKDGLRCLEEEVQKLTPEQLVFRLNSALRLIGCISVNIDNETYDTDTENAEEEEVEENITDENT